jgi:5-methylcytosine-specific restriction protein B
MTRVWGIHNDETPARELVDEGFISIGWDLVGDLAEVGDDQQALRKLVRKAYPDAKEGAIPVWAGVLRRFAFEMSQGDVVIAADRQARLVNIGLVAGPYRHSEDGSAHPHRRDVDWLVTGVPRTSFTQPALNEIGSAVTLFEVKRHVDEFLEALAAAGHPLAAEAPEQEAVDRGEEKLRNLSDEYLRAIRSGDSAFTPGRPVWNMQTVVELEQAFVDRPDLGAGSFDSKLDDQLAGASDDALQLFAELWCLSLAPLTDYSPAKKRELLNRVLTKMENAVQIPSVVDAALDAKAFKGGVAFKTRRPFQLALLIRFSSAVLFLSDDDRVTALSDPKAFEGLLASIADPNEPAQRCALRWLLFPDYYLPIVSDKHRKAIRDAFKDLLDGTAANLDEELNQIKNALSEDGSGDVEFYQPPLVDRWDPARVLSGVPATLEQVMARSEFKTPRYALASAAVRTLDEGAWSTYTDVADVAGLVPGQVGDYLDKVHHDAGHRVIKIDGSTYQLEQQEALEAEGIEFDVKGRADPNRKVTKEDLRERLDALGLLPKVARRAWLVRGSNVKGEDLVPAWLKEGLVSLAATSLREVEAGLTRDQLRPIVDEDYAHASYAARAEKLDDFHAFLSRMQPGHLIVTIDQGRLHLGEIGGDSSYQSSTDVDARLVRSVEWRADATPVDDLPADLGVRLRVQRDVLDLTQHLELLEKLFVAEASGHVAVEETPLVLRDATDELADALHVGRPWLQECIELLKDRPQMIFYGPPGTGKTYIALALAEHLAGENVRLVQFHPSYSYEDFFEGFRPTTSGGFELKPGPMRRIVDQAIANPKEAHVLIIDEINRGNLAKVFGELYFLLEYRDRNVELLYGDGDFSLPENVFIIGTMNTADRSIALVDAAMRRRFAFLALHPSEAPIREVLRAWLKKSKRPERVADLLAELNLRIADPDFRIGPSYFMREKVFTEGGLERAWRTTIVPLLEEHHFGEMTGAEVEAQYGYTAIAATVDGRVVGNDDAPSQTD